MHRPRDARGLCVSGVGGEPAQLYTIMVTPYVLIG